MTLERLEGESRRVKREEKRVIYLFNDRTSKSHKGSLTESHTCGDLLITQKHRPMVFLSTGRKGGPLTKSQGTWVCGTQTNGPWTSHPGVDTYGQ